MDYQKKFSTKLRIIRKEKKITIQELADTLGLTNQAVSLLELGKRFPSFEVLCAIADYFKVTPSYMLRYDTLVDTIKNLMFFDFCKSYKEHR